MAVAGRPFWKRWRVRPAAQLSWTGPLQRRVCSCRERVTAGQQCKQQIKLWRYRKIYSIRCTFAIGCARSASWHFQGTYTFVRRRCSDIHGFPAKRLTSHCEVEVCNTKKRDAQDDAASGSSAVSWWSRWMFHVVSKIFQFPLWWWVHCQVGQVSTPVILCEDPWILNCWKSMIWSAIRPYQSLDCNALIA